MKTLLLAGLLLVQRPGAIQGGSVTGRVLLPDGSPAAMVRVSAVPAAAESNQQQSSEGSVIMALAETDAEGRYQLTGIAPGRYYIAAGFLEVFTYYPGTRTLDTAKAVTVSASGAAVKDIDFKIERASVGLTVSGRLVRNDKQPITEPMQVTLGGDQYGNEVTHSDGAFTFTKLHPGSYMFYVSTPGMQPQPLVLTDHDLTGLEFVVPWTVKVSGRVIVDGNGLQPQVTMAFTGAAGANGNAPARASFNITLIEGSYGVSVLGIPSGYFLKSITADSADLLTTPLRLSKDSRPPELVVSLGVANPPPWVKVSGRILGYPPSPTAQSTLSLNGATGSLTANVGPDGRFEFSQVFPGSYTASFQPFPGTPPSAILSVPNRDLTNLDLRVPAMKEILGQITVADGGPLPRADMVLTGASVAMRSAENSGASLSSIFVTTTERGTPRAGYPLNISGDGSFKAMLPEGEYAVSVNLNSGGNGRPPYEVRSLMYGNKDVTKTPLTITSSDSSQLKILFAPQTPNTFVTVSGRVQGLDTARIMSAPASQPASVSLSSPAFLSTLTAVLAPDGTFAFPRVYSGAYTAQLTGRLPALAAMPSVPLLVDRADVRNVQLIVPPQREILGRVTTEGRGAVPRFTMVLVPSAPTVANPVFVGLDTRADGTFKVAVPEGQYRFSQPNGLPPGYGVKSIRYGNKDVTTGAITVAATDTDELRITITTPQRLTRVTGKVIGLDSIAFSRAPVLRLDSSLYAIPPRAPIAADGTFEFADVAPGNYTTSLENMGDLGAVAVSVVVSTTDVSDIQVSVPGQVDIQGQVVVLGESPMVRPTFQALSQTGTPRFLPTNAQPNGSFRLTLPEGEWKLGNPTNLPTGYVLKAATYGSADVLQNPMKVSKGSNLRLVLTVAAPAQTSFTVGGRIEGLDEATISRRAAVISLTAPWVAGELLATVAADRTFEFSGVYPGAYSASLRAPGLVNAPSMPVNVSNANIADLRFVAPKQKTITGHVVVEGGGTIPRMALYVVTRSSNGPPSGSSPQLSPQPDGSFKFDLPEGEHQVTVPLPPTGYIVKSLTYGDDDLLRKPLMIASADSGKELRIVLNRQAMPPGVTVSGQITGIRDALRSMTLKIVLLGGNLIPAPEITAAADGTFTFTNVQPGIYSARLNSGPLIYAPSPVPVVVADKDVRDVRVTIPPAVSVRVMVVLDGGDGKSVPPIVLEIKNRIGQPLWTAGVVGTLTMPLIEGELSVSARDIPAGLVVKSMAYGSTDLLSGPMKLGAKADSDIVVHLASDGLDERPILQRR
jgi:hypothetical protein